jgi:steroid Delta-isomerase
MPTRKEIEQVVARYAECLAKGDAGGALALFTSDAIVRDPADAESISGEDALLALLTQAAESVVEMELTGPVRVLKDGSYGAAPLRVLLEMDGARIALDSIDVFGFDDSCRITSMTAYWGPENMQQD